MRYLVETTILILGYFHRKTWVVWITGKTTKKFGLFLPNVIWFWKISLNVTLKYIELHNLLWPQQKDYRTFQSIPNYFLVIQGIVTTFKLIGCSHSSFWLINILVVKCDIRTNFPKSCHKWYLQCTWKIRFSNTTYIVKVSKIDCGTLQLLIAIYFAYALNHATTWVPQLIVEVSINYFNNVYCKVKASIY